MAIRFLYQNSPTLRVVSPTCPCALIDSVKIINLIAANQVGDRINQFVGCHDFLYGIEEGYASRGISIFNSLKEE